MLAQRKYPDELDERAVKMVLEIRQREGKGHGEVARVGRQLGESPRVQGRLALLPCPSVVVRPRYDTKLWMRDLMEGAAYLPK